MPLRLRDKFVVAPNAAPGATPVYLPQNAALVDQRGFVTREWWPWFQKVVDAVVDLMQNGGGGGGTGDVTGPASAENTAIALFDGTTGKIIKDSGTTIPELTTQIQNSILPIDLNTETSGMLPAAKLGPHASTHQPGGSDVLQLSAESRLFGRGAGALAGPVQEVTLGSNLSMSGTVLSSTGAAAVHAPTHQSGGSDPLKLDTLAAPTDITTLNASASAHGLLPKLSGSAAQFLNGNGAWSTPGGGGDVTGPAGATADNLASYNGTTGKIIKDSGVPTAQVARKDQANTFTQTQKIENTDPKLILSDTENPTDAKKFRLVNFNQALLLDCVNDAETTQLAVPLTLARDGSATIGNNLTVNGTGGNVALRNAPNTFTEIQTFNRTIPELRMFEAGAPADARMFRAYGYGQQFVFDVTDDLANTVQATPLILNRGGDIVAGRNISEKGRTTPMGHWMAVPYNAANFTADSGTWTVPSGNVTYTYALIGKTLLLSLYINSSTLSVTPSFLYVAFPTGIIGQNAQNSTCPIVTGGTWTVGNATLGASATNIAVHRIPFQTFATGNVQVMVNLTIQIQ